MRLFSSDADSVKDPFLSRAFACAEKGRGSTAPNPMVGCVIVDALGDVVGEGFHEKAGKPHAEVNALREAGGLARGSTVYVTLEPCNHHGKTPPCTRALIEAGVSTVVCGMPDPNPEVVGAGAAALRSAGIDVRFAEDPGPFLRQNEAWLHWLDTGLPWVRVKTALSLDGHPSSSKDVRTRITGDAARALTMRLRRTSDAVMVGARTAEVDHPSLLVTSRDGTPEPEQPLRVVVGRNLIGDVKLLNDGHGRAVALLPEEWAAQYRGEGEVIAYSPEGGLRSAIRTLGDMGTLCLLVEAGPGLLTAFWELRLINELVLYHGGGVLGSGAPGVYLGSMEPVSEMEIRMEAVEASVLGNDAVTVWRPFHNDGRC